MIFFDIWVVDVYCSLVVAWLSQLAAVWVHHYVCISASFVYRIVSTHQQIQQSPLLYVFFSEVVLLFVIIMKHSFWLSHCFQKKCWKLFGHFCFEKKTEEDPRTAGSCKVEGNWAHLGKQRDARGKCQPRLRDRFRRRRVERSSRVNVREKSRGCGGGMHVGGVGIGVRFKID